VFDYIPSPIFTHTTGMTHFLDLSWVSWFIITFHEPFSYEVPYTFLCIFVLHLIRAVFILFCCDPSFSTRGHKCLITATDSPAPAHIQWNSLVPHRVILHWANMRDATKITVINKVHFCTSFATCFGFKYQAIIMPMYLYILTLYHSACKRLVMETINSLVFLTTYSMWYK